MFADDMTMIWLKSSHRLILKRLRLKCLLFIKGNFIVNFNMEL